MTRSLRSFRSGAAHVACLLALAACGDEPARPARDPDLLLVVDGIEVRVSEVEPFVAFYDFLPESSRSSKVRRILTEYTIPLRLSQRAFAAKRKELYATAKALTEVATNAVELQQVMSDGRLPGRALENVRLQLAPPLALFLFDPLLRGSVSPPIEVPEGYKVVACNDVKEAPLVLDDLCSSLQVAFNTHNLINDYIAWRDAEMARVAHLVTYVHPDYREALPPGFEAPR